MTPKKKLKNIKKDVKGRDLKRDTASVGPIVIHVKARPSRSEKLKPSDWLVHCPHCGKMSGGHYSGMEC
jgi:hypothetical protein